MNEDFYQIGDKSDNNRYFIFSTLIAYASNLSLFADAFKINNISGPYSFVYETLFGHLVQTEEFVDINNPSFIPERACVNIRGSLPNIKKFFGQCLETKSDISDNQECFHTLKIYLKAFIKQDTIKPTCFNTKINVAKASIKLYNFLENTSDERNLIAFDNDILLKIEDEVQLRLSPLIYIKFDSDLNLPLIGITILLQRIDINFLPEFILHSSCLTKESLKPIKENYSDCDMLKDVVKQNKKLMKKWQKYQKLINQAKKCIVNLLEKGQHNGIGDNGKDQGILAKIECLEQKLLDMEQDLNCKTLQNIDLSQKVRYYENMYEFGQNFDERDDFKSHLNFVNKHQDIQGTMPKPSSSKPSVKKLSQNCEVKVADIKPSLDKYLGLSQHSFNPDQTLHCSVPQNQLFDKDDPYIKLCKSFEAMTKSHNFN